ncbi:MAG: GNAT family N-acetyltransferase [Gemmatimonadota bacterium]|nr:GNAT family N-acetyltransferase [Gemmatimonadota bacterium]
MSAEHPAATLRRATPDDVEALGRLGALLVQTHHDLDPKRFIPVTPHTEDGYGNFLLSQLAEPDILVMVAEREGRVVGYAYAAVEGIDYMTLRGPAGVLHDIVVDPAHRRAGVGSLLFEETIAALRDRGARQLVLSTAEGNVAAQRLCVRAGFRRTLVEMTRDE